MLVTSFSAKAQESPHYSAVLSAYRKDKQVLDNYAMTFIVNNPELFIYKQTGGFLGNHTLVIDTNGYAPYRLTDSGVIAKCVYIYRKDTLYADIGFLSKNNRTKIVLLGVENYRNDHYVKDFLRSRVQTIIGEYHNHLRTKYNDNKTNW